MDSVWHVLPEDPQRAQTLARALEIDPITAQLLINRGLTDAAPARNFLHPTWESLGDPAELPDMARAVARLRQAIAKREAVLVFGDSDVDGLTANVILYEVLRELGAIVRSRQSNRIADGYGLPERFIEALRRSTTTLLILVDCGTNQADAIRRLASHGIDTIIVDHHVPIGECARPLALINPHRDPSAAHHGLSSAGLAFKVVQALCDGDAQERLEGFLDLAALGTLADCSPLVGENRTIVALGLERIVRSARRGLRRLCEATRTDEPDVEQVIHRLVPRLNASGRLGDPAAVWHLLLDGDGEPIDGWLEQAEAAHATTRHLHRQLIGEAQEQVNRLHFKDQYVLIVSRSGWPQGLMGSLASQLTQRYGRPSIALALDAHQGNGSGRSIPLFNLLEALKSCQELLVRFGGHAQACGLTLDRKHLEPFQLLLNQQAERSMGREGLRKTRTIDVERPLAAVGGRWVEEGEQLAPFGQGNPRPSVVIRGLTLEVKSPRMAIASDGVTRVMARGPFTALASGAQYDVVASPGMSEGACVLTVSELRTSGVQSGPGQPSGMRYTREFA